MPRKNNRSNRRRSNRSGGTNRPVTVRGMYYLTETVAATSPASILINPSIFPRTNTFSSVFQSYRFKWIKITMLPLSQASAVDNIWVLGFSSDVSQSISSVTSQAQISECTPSGIQSNSTVSTTNTASFYPTAIVRLSSRDLVGNASLKWFKCVGDTGTNNWENYQGQLLFYNPSAGSATFEMRVEYECEFTSPISSILT